MAAFMAQFNWVDYVFIAVFGLSILAGFVRGLVREVLALLVLVAAFVVAIIFSNSLATHFTQSAGTDSQTLSYLAIGISFGVLFTATVIAGAIISFFLSLIFQSTVLGFGNRLLGAIFGFMRGFIINLVIVFVVQLTTFGEKDVWKQSKLVGFFQPSAAWLSGVVSPTFEDLKSKFTKQINDATKSATETAAPSTDTAAPSSETTTQPAE